MEGGIGRVREYRKKEEGEIKGKGGSKMDFTLLEVWSKMKSWIQVCNISLSSPEHYGWKLKLMEVREK